ncbi:hypothetical protein EVG20_g10377 [Dentipellis fragilis]|uniref:Uncharacterized protein n=1 Tax=Dentipellis fragilis TaxID=205917 RepID=A0A4Y9XRT7_9AGAM|nr:hypothetical protein EVG20_g10377 [Dentipellis fragilis]
MKRSLLDPPESRLPGRKNPGSYLLGTLDGLELREVCFNVLESRCRLPSSSPCLSDAYLRTTKLRNRESFETPLAHTWRASGRGASTYGLFLLFTARASLRLVDPARGDSEEM